jgi:hypothetical protein
VPSEPLTVVKAAVCIRTLRLKVKAESYPWLNAAAIEINQVWNFANETCARAARPFAGKPRWLSAYDLDNLTAGASPCFEHIGSDTIQRVNAEFVTRRNQFKKLKLRWRVSGGTRRSLGWIPFKAVQLKRQNRSLRFCGKSIRVFEREYFRMFPGNAAASRKMQLGTAGCVCPRSAPSGCKRLPNRRSESILG